jgi:hypothetical protein
VIIIRYLDDSGKPDMTRLKRAVENGYILVKFPNTKGGTELGANTKNEDSECSATIDTTNNVIKVKCVRGNAFYSRCWTHQVLFS